MRFRRDTPKAWMDIAHGVVRAKVLQDFPPIDGLYLVQIPADETVEDAIRAYQNQPEVLYAQPNFKYYPSVIPNDPCFTGNVSGACPAGNRDMWGLHNTGGFGGTSDADIDAPEAWDITTGSASVAVVVIDTGIDFDHPDLAANMAQLESNCSDAADNDGNGFVDDCRGINTIGLGTPTSNPFDDINHGTHVSGTIGAVGNNSTGVVGVNHTVKLIACKFLGAGGGFTDDAIQCLNYILATKAAHPELQFVGSNNSWGGRGFDQALADAIEVQRQNGLLFIAAAGNENADNDWILNSPANIFQPNVIAVAATTRNDGLAAFSNYGKQTVHIGAPGQTVLSTTPANTYSFFSGTSMATPHTTGVAALLKAQDGTRDWKKIKNLILSSGDPISALTNTVATGRRLNARNAMTCSGQTVDARELPVLDVVYGQVGVPIPLAMLHINCADPAAGNPQVAVSGGSPITLLDNGSGVDEENQDGVFSGTFTPGSAVNTTLTFPGGDVVAVFFPTNPIANYNAGPFNTTFSYRNLTGAAKNLSFEDDTRALVESPFPIAYGGGSFRLLNLSNNGNVTFDTSFSSADFDNIALPRANPATFVAAWWDDLFSYPDDTGPIGTIQNVRYEVQGSAPNRELILEWKDVEHIECPVAQIVTFEMVFFENSSNVLFQYLDTSFGTCGGLSRNNGASATVGVQVSPSLARQFSFNTASLSNFLALLFVGPVGNNPVPSLGSLVPNNANAGGPQFTLTVNGSNFVGGSVVRWNGSDRTTTFINANQLTATIPASDIAAPGMANVTVFNPAPGGGTSNTLVFTINNPIPAITSLSPDTIPATNPDFTLTVNGFNFVNGAVVRFRGVNKSTTFMSSTKLTATIPAADVASVGTAQVTVANLGALVSNALTFTIGIRNPLPTITSLSPTGSTTTGAGIPLTVFGSNFVFNSTVRWNGANRTTTFVNSGQLQASLNAGDLSSPGTGMVTVVNAAPGGGTSNTAGFPISANNPVPVTLSLSLTSVVAGTVRGSLTFNVNGTGSTFVGASVVRWNGSNRTTVFVNANTLTVTVPSSDVAVAGTASVTVFTPAPGGGTSNPQTFTINNPSPGISSLSPSNTAAGGPQFILTVIGSNFVPGSVVRWNGVNRPTMFIGSNQLRATIPASDIVSPGAANITVLNPTPGGGASNIVGFTIN